MDFTVTIAIGQQLTYKPCQVQNFLRHPGLTCNNLYHHKVSSVVPSAVAHASTAPGLDAPCVLNKLILADCTGMLALMQLGVG